MIRQLPQRLAAKNFYRLAIVTLVAAAAVAALLARSGRAETPAGGTLTAANTPSNPLTFTGGPYPVGNPSNFVSLVCSNPAAPCDDYALDVSLPAGMQDTNEIRVMIGWPDPNADVDMAIYQRNADGTVGARVTQAGTSSDPEIALLPAVSGSYVVRVIPFAPLNQTVTGHITVEPKASRFTQSSTPAPQYRNYAAPADIGGDAGEPSIGVNWNSGNVMFMCHFLTLRVKFDDTRSPAAATWADVSPTWTSAVTEDPILWTDSTTGRTIVSQLAGTDSISASSDNDGDSWTPTEGGPLTSGVDHQTVGGGPFAAPIPQGLNPVYPHAVYYCSQDLVTAFCARSDDGGLTFGPTVPMFLQTCGGIHGHVKVAPDGTVYVPNRSCGSNQGVLVSQDNGITWEVRTVADTDPTTATYDSISDHWDPAVDVGSSGTLYFGYDNGDGTPHVAVSHDKGASWVSDQNVGIPYGIKDTAFPAVVGGDDNRAAFAFLGSQVPSGSDAAEWHLYVATTYDGGNSWTTVDATPNDPVQRGTICFDGFGVGACPKGDRNLLDFMGVTVDKLGRVLVGYSDGCVGCTSAGGSRSKRATVARQTCGTGLFAASDGKIPSCAAPTPTPTPTATPTPTPTPTPGDDPRCDPSSVTVVTDDANDQTGAPSANQNTDIRAVSVGEKYSPDGQQFLVVRLKVSQIDPVLLPPNTFWQVNFNATHADGTVTTYFVNAATNSNSNPAGIAYRYGFLDTTGATPINRSAGNADNGSIDANTGTITITLNTNKLKKPVPGSTGGTLSGAQVDLSAGKKLEAVNAQTSVLVGAAGTGLSEGIDSTSSGDYTMAGAAACPAIVPTPPPGDPKCTAPGLSVLTDPAGDQFGAPNADSQLDITSLKIAEPYTNASDSSITFTLKVNNLTTPVQPNSIWNVYFNARDTSGTTRTMFVSMNTADAPGVVSYNYGYTDSSPTGGGLDLSQCAFTGCAQVTGSNSADGTITLKLNTSAPLPFTDASGNPAFAANLKGGGVLLDAVNARTEILVGAAGSGSLQDADTTDFGSYTTVGNAACNAATPTPSPTATPTPPPPPSPLPRYTNYYSPAGVAESFGEPSIGADWKTGKLMFFGGLSPYAVRVGFDDSSSPARVTWERTLLTTNTLPRAQGGDPILVTDKDTGRTFVSQLQAETTTSTMDVTDDDGASYKPAAGFGIASGIDHQTLGVGPFHSPAPAGAVYQNAVYYCAQEGLVNTASGTGAANCALSVDGGLTFGPAVPVYVFTELNGCGPLHGHLKVAPDGTAYLPDNRCGNGAGVVVSQDNGVTWTAHTVTGSTVGDTDPSVGVAKDGSVYFGFQGSNHHPYAAVSRDKGATWTNLTDVGAPLGIQNAVFPAVVAGDGGTSGRAAFAFIGSSTAGDYNNANFAGVWYLYIASTFDGGRTWTTINATPNDPVQRGGICTTGTACTGFRNLLDFFDATVDKQGRVAVGYVDGCVGPCVQAGPNSYTAKGVIARQSGGLRMFAADDTPEPAKPGAPLVTALKDQTTGYTHVAWPQPDANGSAVTGYNVYRGASQTGGFSLLATVTGLSYDDNSTTLAGTYYYRVTAVNGQGEGAYAPAVLAVVNNPPSPCTPPGVPVIVDLLDHGEDFDYAQQTPPDARVNIKSVSVAEPYFADGSQKIVFTMQMAPSPVPLPPPSTQWYLLWNRLAPDTTSDRMFVAMKTDATGAIRYVYGRVSPPGSSTDPNINTPTELGTADAGSYNATAGTITITLSRSKAENIQPGQQLAALNARTFLARADAGTRSQLVANDITENGNYVVVGNSSCAPTAGANAAQSAAQQESLLRLTA
ncbi:MAG: exo-alpha-sialidase, partial [Acidobacteria bacterium]|nr:exo-alpha-sialidase [Acidobacteriota bacterium]